MIKKFNELNSEENSIEDGYYWVTFNNNNELTIGRYSSRTT